MLYMIREEVDRYQQCWITRLLMLVMTTIERKGNESFNNRFFFYIEAKRTCSIVKCCAHGTFCCFELCSICSREGLGVVNPQPTLRTNTWTHCGDFLLYPSLTELPSIEIKWALQDVSELGYLFHDKSSLHIVAWDLDVERSHLWYIVLDDVKSYDTIKDLLTKYMRSLQ